MELSRISSGLYRPRVKRLSTSDLQSVRDIQIACSRSESIIKSSRISSSAYRPRVTRVNKKDLPTARLSIILKPKGAPVRSFSQMSSFSYRHRITPISHGDFQSIHRVKSIGSKTVRVSLSIDIELVFVN
jgi:hypothetical protein